MDFIRHILKGRGYPVLTTTSGQECLRKADQIIPGVIILDYNMPSMNGLDVAGRLKENPKTRNVPIIMLTGVDDKKVMRKALMEIGVDYYVDKPYKPDELIDKVDRAIRYTTPE